MSPDDANHLLVALLIVLGAWIAVVALWAQHKRKLAELAAGRDAGNDARLAAMEQRLQTLEAIVTDKGYDVAHQIEALRGVGGGADRIAALRENA